MSARSTEDQARELLVAWCDAARDAFPDARLCWDSGGRWWVELEWSVYDSAEGRRTEHGRVERDASDALDAARATISNTPWASVAEGHGA